MTSQPGKQKSEINILSNILKIKGNQTMKFDQLIEYYMTKKSRQKFKYLKKK